MDARFSRLPGLAVVGLLLHEWRACAQTAEAIQEASEPQTRSRRCCSQQCRFLNTTLDFPIITAIFESPAEKLTHPDSGIEIAQAKVFGVIGAPDEW